MGLVVLCHQGAVEGAAPWLPLAEVGAVVGHLSRLVGVGAVVGPLPRLAGMGAVAGP